MLVKLCSEETYRLNSTGSRVPRRVGSKRKRFRLTTTKQPGVFLEQEKRYKREDELASFTSSREERINTMRRVDPKAMISYRVSGSRSIS